MTDPTRSLPLGGEPDPVTGRRPQDAFSVTPFARLARTHALSTAADAMVATALAGTVFFKGATSDARSHVFLYLLLTMAPFTLVAPLIGPVLDRVRSGRRWMIVGTEIGRAAMTLVMMRDVESLWFYPEAFAVLVLQRGYAVARSALVPATVDSDSELVEANSKLSLISGLMGFLGAAPAALLFRIGGPAWTLGLATITFVAAGIVGLRLSHEPVAAEKADAMERAELRSVGVVLAASAMGLIRGIVGFLTVLLAFDFRKAGVPKWHFALVAGVSVGGSLVGAAVAPRLRKLATEERMIIGTLVVLVLAGFVSFGFGGLSGAALLGLAVGVGSVSSKLAFDSLVQRDAPDANRGRSFAKFETRFQIIWVVGALIGLIEMPARIGFLLVTIVAAFGATSYAVGELAWKHRSGARTPATERAVEIEDKINQGKAAARRGVGRSVRAMRDRFRANAQAKRAADTDGPVPPAASPPTEPPAAEPQAVEPPAAEPAADGPPPFGPPPDSAVPPPFGPPDATADLGPTVPAAPTEPLVGWGRPEDPVTEDTPNWRT